MPKEKRLLTKAEKALEALQDRTAAARATIEDAIAILGQTPLGKASAKTFITRVLKDLHSAKNKLREGVESESADTGMNMPMEDAHARVTLLKAIKARSEFQVVLNSIPANGVTKRLAADDKATRNQLSDAVNAIMVPGTPAAADVMEFAFALADDFAGLPVEEIEDGFGDEHWMREIHAAIEQAEKRWSVVEEAKKPWHARRRY